jgi:hypothetical protein
MSEFAEEETFKLQFVETLEPRAILRWNSIILRFVHQVLIMNTRQSLDQDALTLRRHGCKRARERERESIISRRRRRSSSALTYSLGFMAKNAAGRSLESILQAVKHDYCFEPFTAEDKPQNKNEIKAQLLRFAVKFYHQIHTQRREKRGA